MASPEYDQAPQGANTFGHEPEPHPYLHEPLLYITNLPSFVTDEALAMAFGTCAPFRPKIPRDGDQPTVSGTIEFKYLEKAEKALATLQGRPIPTLQPPVLLTLSPYPPTTPPIPLPPPSAQPRLVKHLPPGISDSTLYDHFRPFGAIASARAQAHLGPDTGMIEFFNEADARNAEEAMHCTEIEGSNIAVQVYQSRRTSRGFGDFNIGAPTFVPTGALMSYPVAQQYSPPLAGRGTYSPPSRGSPYTRSPALPFVHGPGQQVQLAPATGPGSTSHSGLIDPCNLFCKNLDPSIDSNGLFTHFRRFGQIVSARVMRTEGGESRGFGFVSYQTPDQATAALQAMNGATIGSKQIVVRLHEPKQLRQEKLAARYNSGHNGHPRSASGATSPTASEDGYTPNYWGSPRHGPSSLGGSPGGYTPERGRRGSGSYYNAALAGTLNLPMKYDDLASLSPVVRKEVLTGEFIRRVRDLNVVPQDEIDSIVESLITVTLSEVVDCIEDPAKLRSQVERIHATRYPSVVPEEPQQGESRAPSAAPSQDSRLLDANTLNATASAPDHPSTPISYQASLSTPPRTSSPSGSVPPTSERDRMAAAIGKLESERREELTELLMSLPKRERALCLFNVEVLRAKLADAKMVLESEGDEEEEPKPQTAPQPVTPQAKKTAASSISPSSLQGTPQTPDLSSRGPSAASSPQPATPAQTQSLGSLAKLPATEIIKQAMDGTAGLPQADPLVVKATDEFIDGLLDKPVQLQKQQLGDKLFKVVKSFGIKGAPKVTIALLDQEDLRSLAHLMNNYPSVLKEKALAVAHAK